MRDSRKNQREFVATSIQLNSDEGQLLINASILDISEKGALVMVIAPEKVKNLHEGMSVKFAFSLPTGAVAGSGSITRLKKQDGHLGLKFAGIESGGTHLKAFLSNDLM